MDPTALPELGSAFTSHRLSFEPLSASHARLLFDALQDVRIYRWISSTPPLSVDSLQQRWARLEGRRKTRAEAVNLNWALRRLSDGQYIGKVDADINEQAVATNVGYLLFPAFWNHGYATEALLALASHLEACGIAEQWAYVTLGNDASERVMLKAHFQKTRILPDNDTIRGQKYADVEYVRRSGK